MCRFHPTEAVLACGSACLNKVVTIFKGGNGFVPFSNWRIEGEFICGTRALEWNVCYSIFTICIHYIIIH